MSAEQEQVGGVDFRFVMFTQAPERIVSDGRGGLVGIGADGVEKAQDVPGVSGMTFKPFDDETGT